MVGAFVSGIVLGAIAGICIAVLIVYLIYVSFRHDPLRSLLIHLRGKDVELELNEMHRVSRTVDEEQIFEKYKKSNFTVDVHYKKEPFF